MMGPAPVTAIIPVRNGVGHIGEALASISEQTLRPCEVIVVDDGSTDSTVDEIRRFDFATCIQQPASGQAAARNRGARAATSPFLAFLDADDLWTPRKLELQLAVLEQSPGLHIVSGRMVQFTMTTEGEHRLVSAPSVANLPGLQLIRREAFWRVGPFSTEWTVGENIDWWARAIECGLQSTTIDHVVLMRRLHDSNLGRRAQKPMGDIIRILQATVKRRRGDAS